MGPQILLMTTAFIMAVLALLLLGRFLVCFVAGIRTHSFAVSALAVAGILVLLGTVAAIAAVWFAYAVAHTGKDAGTDFLVFASTVPAFFFVAACLWYFSGRLRKGVDSKNHLPR